jgi:hypothetical protein
VLDTAWEEGFTRDREDICAVMRVLGVNPERLFDRPHPTRPAFPVVREVVQRAVEVENLLFATFAARELWLLDTAGRLSICQVSPDLPVVSTTDVTLEKPTRVAFAGGRLVVCAGGRILIVGSDGELECDTELLIGDGDLFAVLENAVVSVFDVRTFPRPTARVALVEGYPLCIALSDVFGLLAAAGTDGVLRYFSQKGRLRATVGMKRAVARTVKVTPAWGLVVVEFGTAFEIFSVNGEVVSEFEHNCEIVEWDVGTLRGDFDVVMVQDIRGEVLAFEAARPERRMSVANVHRPVRFIGYSKDEDMLVVVSATGKVMLITHPFGDIERIE